MALPRPSSPRVVWTDLRAFMQQRPRHQWWAGTLAVMIPMAILAGFYVEARMDARPRPNLYYINSWPADRSDEEIKASQQADITRRREIQVERQRQFQRLEKQNRRLGI